MAVTNSGMTLYADNDTQESWTGTDDLDDYNMSIQGTNSESWIVSKNATETGTLALIAAMGTPKYVTFYMKSDLANYYTDIDAVLRDTSANTLTFTVADSTNRDVSGDFHPSVLQLDQGIASGTYVPNNHDEFEVVIDNSASGNIRSVTNNWIDTIHYGNGRTIAGTTASDKLFLESHIADTTTSDEYDGCSELYKGSLAFQTDIIVDTTTGNSYGETVNFAYARNTDNAYTLSITGTVNFQGTSIIAGTGVTVAFTSVGATSFGMTGGGIVNGASIDFDSGQTITGAVFTACDEVDTNNATFENCTINNTTETTTGSLIIVSAAELGNMDNINFNGYSANNRYAVYIPASVTGSITLPSFIFDDPSSTYCLYWAGTGGTLTVNRGGTTNLETTAWSSAGGTVYIPAASYDFKFTLNPSITGYEWRIYEVTALGSLGGALEKDGEEVAIADNQTYSYEYSSDKFIAVQIISDEYEESITYYTLSNAHQDLTINLTTDDND